MAEVEAQCREVQTIDEESKHKGEEIALTNAASRQNWNPTYWHHRVSLAALAEQVRVPAATDTWLHSQGVLSA